MRKSIIFLCALLALGMVGIYTITFQINTQNSQDISEYQTSSAILQLCNNMSNSDVIWSRDYSGVNPIKFTGATLLLKDVQEDIAPLLIDALTNEDKFVAAHVLLTFREGILVPYKANNWYGLEFQYGVSGITFHGNDLLVLQNHWREKLQP